MKQFTFELDAKLRVKVQAEDWDRACTTVNGILKDNKGKDGTLPVRMDIGWQCGALTVEPVQGTAIVGAEDLPGPPF